MNLFVDSSVWIDYFNGKETAQTDFLHKALGEQEIVVGDLILTEVLQGFKRDHDFQSAKKALLTFPVMPMVGEQAAIQSATNYRQLRAQGVTIRKTIDCLIATFCIENNMALLHSDRDFDAIAQHLPLKIMQTYH